MTTIHKERFGASKLPIWVYHEHMARWRFASNFALGKVVVDCACGVGKGSVMFSEAGAVKVNAFDLSKDAVAAAKHNCASLATVTVQHADGRKLPLDKGTIDLFVSFETIEHISDDRGFLAETVRVLSPDGIFICSTPNRSVTMPGKQISDAPWNPFHVREYSQEEFLSQLTEYFNEIIMYGQNPKSEWRVAALGGLGRILPGHLGGRINSGLKLPRYLYSREKHHTVVDMPMKGTCEYLVALCKSPKQ